MYELMTNLTLAFLGSVFSVILIHILVVGFNWKLDKAIWVAPFAIFILPFFFLIAFPIMMLGELIQSVGNKLVAIGRE